MPVTTRQMARDRLDREFVFLETKLTEGRRRLNNAIEQLEVLAMRFVDTITRYDTAERNGFEFVLHTLKIQQTVLRRFA
jgi:hypothetical protein